MTKAKCISAIQNYNVGTFYPILRFRGGFDKRTPENMIELYETDGSKVIECLPIDLFKKHFKIVDSL